MVRFRTGQRWKQEARTAAGPSDAFGLEVDGIDLLAGAADEPLARVVPDLIEAIARLAHKGERAAEVSLAEAQLELCFFRDSQGALEVSVVRLGRPTRLLRPKVTLPFDELREASLRCAQQLLGDLKALNPDLLGSPRLKALQKRTLALRRRSTVAARESASCAFGYTCFAPGGRGLTFTVLDDQGRLAQWHRKASAALPPLLTQGSLSFQGAGWKAEGPPFLAMLELSRAASEQLEQPALSLSPGLQVSPEAIFRLGLELCFALTTANAALASNPYVETLSERCTEGLAALRKPSAPLSSTAPKPTARRAAGPRLDTPGALRRLRFEQAWLASAEGLGEALVLVPGRLGPAVVGQAAAVGFTRQGRQAWRREATAGVAMHPSGLLLAASAQWRSAHLGRRSAHWRRTHDGSAVGPLLHLRDDTLYTLSRGRLLIAFDTLTGREKWRAGPSRAQECFVAFDPAQIYLASDTGVLQALDPLDGQVRFRLRAAAPFVCAPVLHGLHLLGSLGRRDFAGLIATDARSGELRWSQELPLSQASPPLGQGKRLLVAGLKEGKATALGLQLTDGAVRFSRTLPLHPGRLALLAVGRDAVVQDERGGAVRLTASGELLWALEPTADEAARLVPPVLSRGVLILGGAQLRAVDPVSGRVLAQLRGSRGLLALAADSKLNLVLLEEGGALRCLRLRSHFAVV